MMKQSNKSSNLNGYIGQTDVDNKIPFVRVGYIAELLH